MNKLNSLVIWIDRNEGRDSSIESQEIAAIEPAEGSVSSPTYLELDINLWKPDDDNGYLEIGFKIIGWNNKSCLHCITPFYLTQTEIIDKSHFLREHPAVLDALFNDSLTIKTVEADPRFAEVTRSEGDKSFYLFSPERNLRKEDSNNDGHQKNTHIIVDIPKNIPSSIKTTQPIYVRLRFKPTSYAPIITNENLPARFFSGMSEKMTFIDFRINSMRSISYSLRTKAKSTLITKVKFFLMVDAWSQVVMGTSEHSSARLLEEQIWSDFINHDTESKDKSYLGLQWAKCAVIGPMLYLWNTITLNKQSKSMHYVAYKWSETRPEDATNHKIGYDNFIKVKSSKSSRRSVSMTFFAILLAGFVASTIANILWNYPPFQQFYLSVVQQDQKNASN